jgi:hemoglobin
VFEQFGGEPGLVALMDELMVRLLADPRLRSYFQQADQAAVKKHLVEQVCAILGGGCAYTGRDMRRAHAGLGIDRADFNALVEDLQLAMQARRIPFRAQNRLLAKLAPMHREIEEK